MKNLIKYSGLVTKIRAMQSHMLTIHDYKNMVHMTKVKDVTLYLKNCPAYSEALVDIGEDDIHRGIIEKKLIISMYKDYEKIYKFTNGKDRYFLNAYFIYFEVGIIKTLLKIVFDSRTVEYDLLDFEKFFMEHSNIDIKKLSKSKNIVEFIEFLKGTDYYNIVALLHTGDNISLFDIEMRLDIYYFSQTWKLRSKYLSKNNKRAITPAIGTKVDLLNIMWIYRAKTYYEVDNDIIYSYIIPIRYRLKKQQIKQMIESKDDNSLVTEIKSTPYAEIVSSFQKGRGEKFYYAIVERLLYRASKQYSTSLAPVTYFMQHKEIEIGNITKIIESIRYGLQPEAIMEYVNIYNKSGGDVA